MGFNILHTDAQTHARTGVLTTAHGEVRTPVFMPVGTQGTVKAISPLDLEGMGVQVVLSNTYHLFLRPGTEIIKKGGGLHRFMGWHKPILTDSGGYQVFSLAELRHVSREGVEFQSHIDGTKHFLSPGDAMVIQNILGSDIMMALDECIPYPCTYNYACNSLDLTLEWAILSKKACEGLGGEQTVFGIVQGSVFRDLRKRCAEQLQEIGFDGYAIGGLSVGEPVSLMFEVAGYTAELLPPEQPRYLMGCGTPVDILECVALGIDMFDCVMPTRNGRNGTAFTPRGKLPVKNGAYKADFAPLCDECRCSVCQNFSRAYIRHLFNSEEMLGPMLVTYHNLYFYTRFMEAVRDAVTEGRFEEFKRTYKETYTSKQ